MPPKAKPQPGELAMQCNDLLLHINGIMESENPVILQNSIDAFRHRRPASRTAVRRLRLFVGSVYHQNQAQLFDGVNQGWNHFLPIR